MLTETYSKSGMLSNFSLVGIVLLFGEKSEPKM
jgi:hypothetical protein